MLYLRTLKGVVIRSHGLKWVWYVQECAPQRYPLCQHDVAHSPHMNQRCQESREAIREPKSPHILVPYSSASGQSEGVLTAQSSLLMSHTARPAKPGESCHQTIIFCHAVSLALPWGEHHHCRQDIAEENTRQHSLCVSQINGTACRANVDGIALNPTCKQDVEGHQPANTKKLVKEAPDMGLQSKLCQFLTQQFISSWDTCS